MCSRDMPLGNQKTNCYDWHMHPCLHTSSRIHYSRVPWYFILKERRKILMTWIAILSPQVDSGLQGMPWHGLVEISPSPIPYHTPISTLPSLPFYFIFFCTPFFIRYFLDLHFKCYPKSTLYPTPALLPYPPTPTSWPWHSPVLGHIKLEPRCPSKEEWIQKMWYIYIIMEYYSAVKNNGFMKFLDKWMYLEDIILSEVTQS